MPLPTNKNHRYPCIGFSTNVFDNPAEIEEIVQKILLDFNAIEIELEDEALERISAADEQTYINICEQLKIQLKQVEFLSVHAPYLKKDTNLASDNPEMRNLAIAKHKLAIKFCADIGGRYLTFHPGFNTPDKATATMWLLESLKVLIPYAKEYQVELCMENMGNERPKYLVFDAQEHLELHHKTGIFVTLDLVHLCTWGFTWEELKSQISIYAPITRVIHFNDMPQNKHRHIPLGQGVLPIKALLAYTKECGYQGAAIVDEFSRPIAPQEYLQMTSQFVQDILREDNYANQ